MLCRSCVLSRQRGTPLGTSHVHIARAERLPGCAGQLQYASPELRLAKGLNNKARADQYKDRLITPVEQITEAFWDTKWGKAMRDELKNKRFKK